MDERVREIVETILDPLLAADGGGIEVRGVGEDGVTLFLKGEAAYGVGGHFLRTQVVEPALRRAVGAEAQIRYEYEKPRGSKRPPAP